MERKVKDYHSGPQGACRLVKYPDIAFNSSPTALIALSVVTTGPELHFHHSLLFSVVVSHTVRS